MYLEAVQLFVWRNGGAFSFFYLFLYIVFMAVIEILLQK